MLPRRAAAVLYLSPPMARTLPHNNEAEAAILGGILLRGQQALNDGKPTAGLGKKRMGRFLQSQL